MMRILTPLISGKHDMISARRKLFGWFLFLGCLWTQPAPAVTEAELTSIFYGVTIRLD